MLNADKAYYQSAFDIPSESFHIRRDYIYEDAFEKLSLVNGMSTNPVKRSCPTSKAIPDMCQEAPLILNRLAAYFVASSAHFVVSSVCFVAPFACFVVPSVCLVAFPPVCLLNTIRVFCSAVCEG